MEENKKQKLVLDSNAFIQYVDLNSLEKQFELYTVDSVRYEIKDERARQKFAVMEMNLKFKQPTLAALQFITNFAKLTGDFISLSDTDKEVIALAYTLAIQSGASKFLRKEPPTCKEFNPKEKKEQAEEKIEKKQKEQEKKKEEKIEDDESSSDDDEGWINQNNIKHYLSNCQVDKPTENQIDVFVLTTDFAMQNVILQIGIPLISPEGFQIRSLKRFVLECYSCKQICKILDKEFCPTCGNHTLLKVTCSINDDGSLILYRKKNFHVNTRGQQFNIPNPKGGRNNNDMLLREDEFMMNGRDIQIKQQQKQKEKQMQQQIQDYDNGTGFMMIAENKKHQEKSFKYGYGRTNPNDPEQFKKKFKSTK